MRDRLVRRELGLHLLRRRAPDGDEGSFVAHGVAVVGRGEDGDALAVVADLVAVVLDFVTADDVVEAVALEEVRGDVRTKLAADASFGRGPAAHGVRVAPQELAHNALFRRLPIPFSLSDVVKSYPVLKKRQDQAMRNRQLKA